MNKLEIIETLKTHKKYSSNCRFEEDYVFYTIGNNEHKIEILDNWKKLTFSFNYSKYGVKEVQVTFEKEKANKKKALSKFREVIKSINTLDFFLKKREELVHKIKPAILSYIKEQFYIDNINFDGINNVFRMNFPKTCVLLRRRYRTTNFDPSKEKIENNLIFKPYVNFKDSGYNIRLDFIFRTETGKLILTTKEEEYSGLGKDVTKIIRGEKLKRLMFSNEESE